MADKKKAPSKTYVLPKGTAAHAHIARPDDDGQYANDKFKVTVVLNDLDGLDTIEADIRSGAAEKFGKAVDWDTFKFPWRERTEDEKNEAFRNKVTITAQSQFQPKVYDAKRNLIPVAAYTGNGKSGIYTKMNGDVIKAMVTIYLYEKTEKVREGKKMVDVTVHGASLQLVAIQIIDKRAGGGGDYSAGFDEEDGYEADAEQAASGDNSDF